MKVKTQTKILLLSIIAIAIGFLPSKVFAGTYGDFEFTIKSDDTIRIDGTSTVGENATTLNIPSTISGYKVNEIRSGAFSRNIKVTTVTIPGSVTELGYSSFYNCTNLKSVSIENGPTILGDSMFGKCTSLTNVNLPSTITDLDGAFIGCSSLKYITLPSGLTNLGSTVFEDCTSLTTINIPSKVTEIPVSAFEGCTNLTTVSLPDNITKIGSCAFQDCANLKNINMPKKLTMIEWRAFLNCTSLTNITFYNALKQISDSAFIGCSSLTKVVVPRSVDLISSDGPLGTQDAFKNCNANLTFYVNRNSYAHKYALNHDIKVSIYTINLSNCSISNISNKTYTGNTISSSVTIKDNAETLVDGKDYTLTYLNNKNPGKATVTIKGKGDYTGTVTKNFYIMPKNVTGVKNSTQTTSSITLKWNKVTGATGYEVYQYNSSKKKYVKVKTTTSTSYKATKLKAGTTYKFKVRAYKTVDKTNYYGYYSSVTNLATKPSTPKISKLTTKSKKATIQWNKITGASGYELYMSTSQKGKYSKIKTSSKGSTVKYTKSSLKKNKKYYFKVRAYKTVNGKKIYSSYSSVKSIKVKS